MPMGRRPIPGHLKLLKGTYRKDREPRNPPKPEGALLRCPDWLTTPEQKQAWAWAISSAPPGLYKKLDRALVTIIALAEAEVRECTAKIAETGLVLGSKKYGVVTSPFVRTRRLAMLVLLRALAEAGATPASRSRIEIEPEGGAPDEWDEILET